LLVHGQIIGKTARDYQMGFTGRLRSLRFPAVPFAEGLGFIRAQSKGSGA
jgi:hypothetical protein